MWSHTLSTKRVHVENEVQDLQVHHNRSWTRLNLLYVIVYTPGWRAIAAKHQTVLMVEAADRRARPPSSCLLQRSHLVNHLKVLLLPLPGKHALG